MDFATQVRRLVLAGFSGIWIRTDEPEDAAAVMALTAAERGWNFGEWDLARGLSEVVYDVEGKATRGSHRQMDPMAVLAEWDKKRDAEEGGKRGVLALHGFHKLLGNALLAQRLANSLHAGSADGLCFAVLAPNADIPPELSPKMALVDHALPGIEERIRVLEKLHPELSAEDKTGWAGRAAEAAAGLTRAASENAYALAQLDSEDGRPDPLVVWDRKSEEIEKGGFLRVYKGGAKLSDLGGMAALKSFHLRLLDPSRQNPDNRPLGTLLLGVSGGGKSQFAKSLGSELGIPTLILDIGALMGGIVGESESRTRSAIRAIDEFGRAIILIDELEKALAGGDTSGKSDGGVGARMLGSLLTWMADRTSPAFLLATSNDISKLPIELSRAERFDGIFFCDLPSAEERAAIWDIYLKKFRLEDNPKDPAVRDIRSRPFTGAEVRSCCRLASLLGISLREAAEFVVPITSTAGEQIEALRGWAQGRCLSSSYPGIYRKDQAASPAAPRRRRVGGESEN